MKSKKTREKILDESLALFNIKKSSNVSTVQISTAMNISPGNLYYYFANKEEVIRCIWKERMVSEIDSLIKKVEETETLNDLVGLINECFEHFEKFRFFYNESSTLFINDVKLEKLYVDKSNDVIECLVRTYTAWHEKGTTIALDERQKYYFAANLMKIMNSSLIYYDSEVTQRDGIEDYVKSQIMHLLAYLEIYFSEDARDLFKDNMDKIGIV